MVYKGSFKDIIYPAASREPRVARYRIVLAGHSNSVRAIVHLVHGEPSQPQQPDLAAVLDVVLGRIVREDLIGVRLDRIQLVVQTGPDFLTYPIRFNALEFRQPKRGVTQSGRNKDEPVHIRSHDVTGGSVAFYVDHNGAKPVAAKLATMLQ
ncbi:hypothetical protein LMG28614_07193 [Paraburkholderia ultramafica]|uniref:Uncharacterized protein n=1 Tax=Paraburkholderia ultramafica TaxID=1544867 RepID=A0A6S7BZP1_9BURK|nr:hypothetical protein [Paraburkholderia ultramafica]CAB3810082.1 hypothetical protein LMG28614_07193 [Paraburkholderia ultramafica]